MTATVRVMNSDLATEKSKPTNADNETQCLHTWCTNPTHAPRATSTCDDRTESCEGISTSTPTELRQDRRTPAHISRQNSGADAEVRARRHTRQRLICTAHQDMPVSHQFGAEIKASERQYAAMCFWRLLDHNLLQKKTPELVPKSACWPCQACGCPPFFFLCGEGGEECCATFRSDPCPVVPLRAPTNGMFPRSSSRTFFQINVLFKAYGWTRRKGGGDDQISQWHSSSDKAQEDNHQSKCLGTTEQSTSETKRCNTCTTTSATTASLAKIHATSTAIESEHRKLFEKLRGGRHVGRRDFLEWAILSGPTQSSRGRSMFHLTTAHSSTGDQKKPLPPQGIPSSTGGPSEF